MLPSLELYVGEARLLAIAILRDRLPVTPNAATVRVRDQAGNDVIPESPVGISGNRIYFLISGHDVTKAAGTYTVIWKAVCGDEVFIVRQAILVREP